MNNKNSGYFGYSMSNRAKSAYESGKKPFSKWTKGDLIAEIADAYGNESAEIAKKYSLKEIKEYCLFFSEYHHTGKMCNTTDFYAFDWNNSDPKHWPDHERAKKEKPAEKWALIWYETYENRGSKSWTKWYTVREKKIAVLKGSSARVYDMRGDFKTVRNFEIIKELNGKPRKNAKVLKEVGETIERKGYKAF